MVCIARNLLSRYLLITCGDPGFPSQLCPNAPSAQHFPLNDQLVRIASAFCVETECTVSILHFTQGRNPKHEKKSVTCQCYSRKSHRHTVLTRVQNTSFPPNINRTLFSRTSALLLSLSKSFSTSSCPGGS